MGLSTMPSFITRCSGDEKSAAKGAGSVTDVLDLASVPNLVHSDHVRGSEATLQPSVHIAAGQCSEIHGTAIILPRSTPRTCVVCSC